MRIIRRQPDSGSILVTTILFCSLVGVVLVAYLSMVGSQRKAVFRSQVWNECIPMCEAGVEEAMSHLNHEATLNNFAINGWVLSNGAYRKERSLNGGKVKMAIGTDFPPTITVNGLLPAPLLQTNYLTRNVRVKTKLSRRFQYGILSKGVVTFSGTNPRVDSYNSTNFLQSTGGQYDPLKFTDHATVVTTATTAGAIDLGGADIFGKVATGPGGTATLGSGSIGSTLWNSNPLNGGKIEPGYSANDANVYIPDAVLPSPFGPAVMPASGTVGGTNYTYVLSSGDYQVPMVSLGNGQTVYVSGKVRILVDGDTSVSGSGQIVIAPGASIEYYSRGNVNVSGNGIINGSGVPKDFTLVGLPTCTTINYTGNAKFVGTMYAPSADLKIAGGGSTSGAFVGKSVKIAGDGVFHFDEALMGDPREGRFVATSWEEI